MVSQHRLAALHQRDIDLREAYEAEWQAMFEQEQQNLAEGASLEDLEEACKTAASIKVYGPE